MSTSTHSPDQHDGDETWLPPGVPKLECPLCQLELSGGDELQEHMLMHAGEQEAYTCSTCNKVFQDAASFGKHLRMHVADKPYRCGQCIKSFRDRCSLTRHQRTHSGERPFKCSVCEKRFADMGSYGRHKKIHMGESAKTHHCDFCEKAFLDKSSLNRHVKIHTKEKPFQCQVCEKCFTDSGSFKRHQRVHTGEKRFHCRACGRPFAERASLLRHERNVCNLSPETTQPAEDTDDSLPYSLTEFYKSFVSKTSDALNNNVAVGGGGGEVGGGGESNDAVDCRKAEKGFVPVGTMVRRFSRESISPLSCTEDDRNSTDSLQHGGDTNVSVNGKLHHGDGTNISVGTGIRNVTSHLGDNRNLPRITNGSLRYGDSTHNDSQHFDNSSPNDYFDKCSPEDNSHDGSLNNDKGSLHNEEDVRTLIHKSKRSSSVSSQHEVHSPGAVSTGLQKSAWGQDTQKHKTKLYNSDDDGGDDRDAHLCFECGDVLSDSDGSNLSAPASGFSNNKKLRKCSACTEESFLTASYPSRSASQGSSTEGGAKPDLTMRDSNLLSPKPVLTVQDSNLLSPKPVLTVQDSTWQELLVISNGQYSPAVSDHSASHWAEKDDKADPGTDQRPPLAVGEEKVEEGKVGEGRPVWQAGGKRYLCHECLKTFADSSKLKRHLKIHLGVRDFKCATCGKGFIDASSMRRHESVHSAVKPHNCWRCARGFTDRSGLKKHLAKCRSVGGAAVSDTRLSGNSDTPSSSSNCDTQSSSSGNSITSMAVSIMKAKVTEKVTQSTMVFNTPSSNSTQETDKATHLSNGHGWLRGVSESGDAYVSTTDTMSFPLCSIKVENTENEFSQNAGKTFTQNVAGEGTDKSRFLQEASYIAQQQCQFKQENDSQSSQTTRIEASPTCNGVSSSSHVETKSSENGEQRSSQGRGDAQNNLVKPSQPSVQQNQNATQSSPPSNNVISSHNKPSKPAQQHGPLFVCTMCGTSCPDESSFQCHYLAHHCSKLNNNSEGHVTCGVCNKKFVSLMYLEKHMVRHSANYTAVASGTHSNARFSAIQGIASSSGATGTHTNATSSSSQIISDGAPSSSQTASVQSKTFPESSIKVKSTDSKNQSSSIPGSSISAKVRTQTTPSKSHSSIMSALTKYRARSHSYGTPAKQHNTRSSVHDLGYNAHLSLQPSVDDLGYDTQPSDAQPSKARFDDVKSLQRSLNSGSRSSGSKRSPSLSSITALSFEELFKGSTLISSVDQDCGLNQERQTSSFSVDQSDQSCLDTSAFYGCVKTEISGDDVEEASGDADKEFDTSATSARWHSVDSAGTSPTDVAGDHRCGVCGKVFVDIGSLKRHARLHYHDKNHSCDKCQKVFGDVGSLKRHLLRGCRLVAMAAGPYAGTRKKRRIESQAAEFPCTQCYVVLSSRSEQMQHEKEHRVSACLRCEVCGQSFTDQSTLLTHKLHHAAERPHACDVCLKGFADPSALAKHRTRGCYAHASVVLDSSKLPCSHCSKVFIDQPSFDQHSCHLGVKRHVCSHCGKSFTEACSLKRHLRLHTGQNLCKCLHCGRTFLENSGLKKHLQRRSCLKEKKKPVRAFLYPCTLCQKVFTKRYMLLRHMKSHSGLRPFKCDQCDKTFTESSSLKRHQRQHTGERPYHCVGCNKTYTDAGVLKKHQHRCLLFNRAASLTGGDIMLNRHKRKRKASSWTYRRRSHSTTANLPPGFAQAGSNGFTKAGGRPGSGGELECRQCDKRFPTTQLRQHHVKTMHCAPWSFRCQHCWRTFTTLLYLRLHKKRSHSGRKVSLFVKI